MSSAEEYDRYPYESHAFPQSQPSALAALGRLFGVATAPVSNARVLELGCAGGGNILPLAEHLPDARFVGIDFASRHVERATDIATAASLDNVEVIHGDIAELAEEHVDFDYIICHGVYSWVPDPVKDAILRISRERLAPNGIAYISYNVLPGWHMRGMIRDMMLYHTSALEDPDAKVAQARALLDFMANHADQSQNGAYRNLLESEVQLLRNAGNYYLRHEHLSEDNSALYFHQFMARAHAEKMQYVAEADLASMLSANLPPDVARTLSDIAPDILRMEQYMDFLRNRTFRQTLLTHAETPLVRQLSGETLAGLHLSARLEAPQADGKGAMHFAAPGGGGIATGNPDLITWLDRLRAAWPASLPADAFLDAVPDDNPVLASGDERRARATVELTRCIGTGLIRIHGHPLTTPGLLGERPEALAVARATARHESVVANCRHEPVALDDLGRTLVRAMDGTRTASALTEVILEHVRTGDLDVKRDGQAIGDAAELATIVGQVVTERLARLAQQGMLRNAGHRP